MSTKEAVKIAQEICETAGTRDDLTEVLAALTEERVRSPLNGVGAETAIEAELLTGGPQESEQRGREGEDEAQAVAAGGVAYTDQSAAQSEARVLLVAKMLLDCLDANH